MAKKGKNKQNLIGTAFNPFRIFFILGLSTFIGMIFMFVIFGSERAGTTPWWQVAILPGMTEGENWLFFIGSFIFALFIALSLLSLIFVQKQKQRF